MVETEGILDNVLPYILPLWKKAFISEVSNGKSFGMTAVKLVPIVNFYKNPEATGVASIFEWRGLTAGSDRRSGDVSKRRGCPTPL